MWNIYMLWKSLYVFGSISHPKNYLRSKFWLQYVWKNIEILLNTHVDNGYDIFPKNSNCEFTTIWIWRQIVWKLQMRITRAAHSKQSKQNSSKWFGRFGSVFELSNLNFKVNFDCLCYLIKNVDLFSSLIATSWLQSTCQMKIITPQYVPYVFLRLLNLLYIFFLSGWLNERQDLKKFSDFRFLVEPSDTVAAKNNPVGPILHCAAETGDDYPKPTVKWRRDGQSLKFPDFNDRR